MPAARPVVRPRLPWWQVGLTVVLAAGGFLAATPIRNELEIREHLRIPSTRLNELAIRLQKQERRRASLEAAVGELRHQVAVLEREAAERQSGVARRPIQPGDDPNKTILHYTDIHAVINDLWAAGAEAIAINGERIITRTGLNCVGTTILCNTKRIAPPYTLAPIGAPARLLAHLQRPAGPAEILRAFGFPLRLQGLERVTVPAYRGTTQFTIVRPAGEGP